MIKDLDKLLNLALQIDGGDKDITSNATINSKQQCTATFITKLQGIAAGTLIVERLYNLINPNIEVTILKEDGTFLNRGDAIVSLKGRMIDILRGSRVASSILDTMGSIAFSATKYKEEVKGLKTEICTDFKTIPLFEPFAKEALEIVNVKQYNNNLQQYCYLNDSHILTLGSVDEAVKALRKKNLTQPIEVEVINLNEVEQALALNVDRILLTEMNIDQMKEALLLNRFNTMIGVSNIPIGRIREYAKMGFDYIVVNDLALSVKPMSVYLKVYKRTLK